jgi:predicted amidohydrolase
MTKREGAPLAHFFTPLRRIGGLRIAVTSIQTTEEQAWSAAQGRADRSFNRYRDLNNLLNQILKEKKRPQYIVLPELSLPLPWALRVARKLASNNVSLIAGIEYYRDLAKRLRNDCFVSLVTDWPGYRTNVARLQPKFQPAHGERGDLATLSTPTQLFEPTGRDSVPTVYSHGGFYFSVLICSDLTNIAHRHALRGHVDALFALEWNKDVKTFAPLVEATASDLHSFVIQVNNRLYGDSRIRAPAKEDFQRDIVQVKGGASDYYVIGEINCEILRSEQRKTTASTSFKPVPIGFRMSDRRRGDLSSFAPKWERRKSNTKKAA